MPKLIDYPRTGYTGAWELAEVIDDTGGKCAIETAARKLSRKVSGSFKAIIGSGVKFGLLTSKRDLLTTTTLFKRIKHAYDKQEEIIFHREAFLTPPLFTQLCRKFRSRELPVQMLDVMLIREFNVEEINAQGVAKAFIDGCRMVGLLDEHNLIADIDALAAQQLPRRELGQNRPTINTFRQEPLPLNDEQEYAPSDESQDAKKESELDFFLQPTTTAEMTEYVPARPSATATTKVDKPDAIANLFGLSGNYTNASNETPRNQPERPAENEQPKFKPQIVAQLSVNQTAAVPNKTTATTYQIQISGPGVNTTLSITEEEDVTLAIAMLEKIRRQFRA